MRTTIVMATAAMLMSAICPADKWNSPLITDISGAHANQAKKQTKKATQLRWKARICGVLKEKSLMLFALPAMFYPAAIKVKNKTAPAAWLRRACMCMSCAGAADAVVLCAGPPLDRHRFIQGSPLILYPGCLQE